MAIGAHVSRVMREPLLESILLSLFGGAEGIGGGTSLAFQFVGTQLYGMSPYNPVVMLGSVLTLGISVLVAWADSRV